MNAIIRVSSSSTDDAYKYQVLLYISSPSSIPNLDPFPTPPIVAAQHRPARPVRLDQRQLELRAQHPEPRLLHINRRKQVVGILVSLVIGGRQIKLDGLRGELHSGPVLVDLFQVKRGVHGRRRLVEVVSGLKIRLVSPHPYPAERIKETRTYRTESTFSSPAGLPFPTNKCFTFSVHPGNFKNSSNSSTRFLQHDHPLLPSWKIGCPG